jgi:hypothetical protein
MLKRRVTSGFLSLDFSHEQLPGVFAPGGPSPFQTGRGALQEYHRTGTGCQHPVDALIVRKWSIESSIMRGLPVSESYQNRY